METTPATSAVIEIDTRIHRVSWGAIIAGSFVALGTWLLLHILGMGIGLTAIDPDDSSSLRAVGVGTGIWTLIAPIIGLFVGGLVAGRLAGPTDRVIGAIHGALVWAIATLLALWLMLSMVGTVIGAAVRAGGPMMDRNDRMGAQMGAAEHRADAAERRMDRGAPSETQALQAAESTGKAMIGLFFALLLGVAAAITGASLSVTHERRVATRPPRRPAVTHPTAGTSA